MSTLLTYSSVTSQFPLQAEGQEANPVQLTIVGTNPSPSTPIVIQGVIITMYVGSDASDLVTDTSKIGPVAPNGWNPPGTTTGNGYINYVFQAPSGGATVTGQALQFVFNNVQPNSSPGTTSIVVLEGSNNCNPNVQGDCPTQTLSLTKFPAGWGVVSFWVNPPDINQGQSTTLNWSGPDGTYQIFYAQGGNIIIIPQTGNPPLGNNGTYPGVNQPPLTLETTTTFTLSVSDNIDNVEYTGQVQQTVTVVIAAPAISTFTATLQSINLKTNQMTVSLNWTAQNTSDFHIDDVGIYTGAQALQGSTQVTIALSCSANFLASAYGLPGYSGPPATSTGTLSIPPVAINGFQAARDIYVSSMGSASLFVIWNVSNAVTFSIQPGTISGNSATVTNFSGSGPMAGSNPGALTLSAQGCTSASSSASVLQTYGQPQYLSYDNPGMQGLNLNGNFKGVNFFYGQQLFGWPSISAVSIAKSNQILASQTVFPTDVSYQTNSQGTQLQMNGLINNWAIQTGGQGPIFRMSASLNGTATVQGDPDSPWSVNGGVATIELNVGTTPFQVIVISVTGNFSPEGPLAQAIFSNLLQGWLTQNISSFDPLLSQLSPLLTLVSGMQWLQPNAHKFAYADDSLQRGFVYVACQFADYSGSPVQEVPTLPISPTTLNALVMMDSWYAENYGIQH